VLARTAPPDELVTSFARAAVHELADFCAIDLHDGGPIFRRAAVAIGVGALPLELARSPREVEEAAVPTLVPPETLGPLAAETAVLVPIVIGGAHAGRVWLATLGRTPAFDETDLEVLGLLVERFAGAIAQSRLVESVQRAGRLRDEFLAIVSHELRTPLSTILGWSRLLREDSSDPERLRRGLEVIERSATTQSRIIDDLLDVSRAVSGKLRLDPQNVSVTAVVQEAVDSIRPAVRQKGLAIDVAADGPATARVDPERTRQVVWNLLSNAVKFTPPGGSIRVRVERSERAVRVAVDDTGAGIDPSFLPYVFDRFRQGDVGANRREGGLGLGLALVRAIVEQHGGTVAVQSEGLGRGTAVTVELPTESAMARRNTPIAASRLAPTEDLAGVRILLVDDEADARELGSTILQLHGAEVLTASSAAEAMQRLAEHEIDLLLSDIGMPIEDGRSLVRRALARQPSLKAIALSAYARREDEERAIEAGFSRYLTKPVDPERLIDTVLRVARPIR
jgi:signal transduction histidine kinase/BarA-like signal transduction histidine kinase